jgi:putative tryptophan/tyrosine transport system substrate-binding protein
VRRREFITLLGGAAAMPMVTAGAQERMRRVGILTTSFGVDDPEMQTRNSAFILALREFGWAEGKNVRVEFRSAGGKASDLRKHAAELVSLADVVLANGGQTVSALQDVSRTVPIVFVSVPDPVGAGFVDSLARPRNPSIGAQNPRLGLAISKL